VAPAASFAQVDIFPSLVADLANGSISVKRNLADFFTGQKDDGKLVFFALDKSGRAGAAD
jgi:hypothetical protein